MHDQLSRFVMFSISHPELSPETLINKWSRDSGERLDANTIIPALELLKALNDTPDVLAREIRHLK